MIAAWMLYCLLCALGVSLAAALAERTLLAGRGPVRYVWIAAVVLSVVVPVVAYRVASRPSPAIADVRDAGQLPATSLPDSLATAPTGGDAVETAPAPRWNWRAKLAEADTALAIAWLTLSSVLIAHFLCGTIALAWMRRWWRRDTVQGFDVLVSEATGPALVGALSPAIVVPEWTLSMDAPQVGLMLRHEEEHRRARDGQLLTVAHFAVMAMPWNVALWWQLMRLRVAVELDCDARVLRNADARSYGDLLLEVARPRRRLMLMGATAFAERASQLERRIRAIGRRRGRTSRRARLAVACIGVGVLTAAWVAPRPPAPLRAAPHENKPQPRTIQRDTSVTPIQRPAMVQASVVATPARSNDAPKPVPSTKSQSVSPKPESVERAAVSAGLPATHDSTPSAAESTLVRVGPVALIPRQPLPSQPAQGADSIFARLFAGLTLTPDQEAKARALVNKLQMEQVEQMGNTVRAILAAAPARQAIQAHTDSALQALLTNDADRSLLHSRFAAQAPGGRGRSGGPGGSVAMALRSPIGDSMIIAGGRGARVGGGGVGAGAGVGGAVGGGRGGARGGAGAALSEVPVVDFIFDRYFEGISLTPQQQADAKILLSKMQEDMRALAPAPAPPVLMLRPFSNQVVMSQENADTFAAILSSDADRATLRSRIVTEVVVRQTERPPR